MSSDRSPPWRDRIERAAASPLPKATPFRASTGPWRTLFGLGDERREQGERFTQKKLPVSWKGAVQDLPVPVWARGALLWLLDVPRWIYIVVGSVVLLGLCGLQEPPRQGPPPVAPGESP